MQYICLANRARMIVIKFGGTSVGSAEAITNVTRIVGSRLERKPVVVVSALSKVTDLLYRICTRESLDEDLKALRERHFSVIRELFAGHPKASIPIQKQLQPYLDLISETASKTELTERDKASIISCGELMSSRIVCAALCSAGIRTAWVDARGMMVGTGDPLKSEPDTDEINERVPETIGALPFGDKDSEYDAVITQGFICASASGKAAVLGRGGSDYSASLIGRALDAQAVEIWTDVDGVRTADPRRVPTTRCLQRLSYEQAAEMAHFGAKVLHPLTLEPAQERNIPVYVLNTHNPEGENTVILPREDVSDSIRSVSYKENILVLTMSASTAMDSTGFMKKIFDVLSELRIHADLISTNNSRVSITVDSTHKRIPQAIASLEKFARLSIDSGMAQISAIGSSASEMNSILGNDFAPLRDCRIYMVSPGASFVNISFVVAKSELDDVLRLTHKYLIENESSN